MRALVQLVSEASVSVNEKVTGRIGPGLLVFLGVRHDDNETRAAQLAQKIVHLRIFPDHDGKMNRSLIDACGQLLVVSQFTLYGDTRKGNRPSYSEAANRDLAEELYEVFIQQCRTWGVPVSTGIFQAHMKVQLVNDGPVTIMCYAET